VARNLKIVFIGGKVGSMGLCGTGIVGKGQQSGATGSCAVQASLVKGGLRGTGLVIIVVVVVVVVVGVVGTGGDKAGRARVQFEGCNYYKW